MWGGGGINGMLTTEVEVMGNLVVVIIIIIQFNSILIYLRANSTAQGQ
jgi:hypothetical protein